MNQNFTSGSEQTPKHYEGEVQPWDIIYALKLGFNLGNAVKYIFRAGKKDGNSFHQDIKKAIDYLKKELEDSTEYYNGSKDNIGASVLYANINDIRENLVFIYWYTVERLNGLPKYKDNLIGLIEDLKIRINEH